MSSYFQIVARPQLHGKIRDARELETLARCVDLLKAGRLPELGDSLAGRFLAVESAALTNNWQDAQHLEVIPTRHAGLAGPAVLLQAQKHARQVEKAAGRTPWKRNPYSGGGGGGAHSGGDPQGDEKGGGAGKGKGDRRGKGKGGRKGAGAWRGSGCQQWPGRREGGPRRRRRSGQIAPDCGASPCAGAGEVSKDDDGFWATFAALIPAVMCEDTDGGSEGVLEDPYFPPGDTVEVISKEVTSAGSSQPEPGRFFANSKVATFATPEELGVSLVEGIVRGHFPVGMEGLFEQVRHNTSVDVFGRHRGLFPLPVNWSRGPNSGDAREYPVQAWETLICFALNQLSGCKKGAPQKRQGEQVRVVLENLRSRITRFLSFLNPRLFALGICGRMFFLNGFLMKERNLLILFRSQWNRLRKAFPLWGMADQLT